MKTRKLLLSILIVILFIVAVLIILIYPKLKPFFHAETVKIDNNLTFISGGGGNSMILVTDSAVVVIDTKMGKNAEELYKMVKEKAGTKKIIVINTHYHVDHTKGNKYYQGCKIYIGDYDNLFLQKNVEPENRPTDFVKDSLELNLGNETVLLYNLGQAHTYDDMVVYLKNRNILMTGDLVFNHLNPVLKREGGADVEKWISVLQVILSRWGNATIVPGHGPMGDEEIVASLKQYFEDMKTAALDSKKADDLKSKYKSWAAVPFMSSPEKTIQFIKR